MARNFKYNGENRILSFNNQQLKLNTFEDGAKIAEKMLELPGIDTFEMRGNTLGVEAAIPIAEALESQSYLKRALWSDMFTGRLKEEIPRILKCLCDAMVVSGARLVELDLSDNAIGPMAVPGIRDFLAGESAFGLQVLKLNNCGLGIAGKTVAECLIECHQRSVERGTPLALKTFIAGRNRLEYTSTVALAEAFKRIGTLEVVAMPQNGIRAEGVIKLAEAVRQNKGLKDLNLSDNTFGQSGSIAMAGALESLSQLELVDFGDCLCRNRGSILIARALAQSRSPLKELNLSGNEITVEAAKEIAKILAPMAGIASLKIGVNCFGSQFDDFVDFAQPYGFIDVGEESDDQGTLSDANSDNESESHPEEGDEGSLEKSNVDELPKDGCLSFKEQQLKLDTEADGEKIAIKLRNFAGVEAFEMRGNTLGVDAAIPIARALETQSRLKRALWSDMFTGRLKEEIPRILKCLCDAMVVSGARLVELDLSDNAIGPMAVPGIRDFLAGESAFGLQVLKLNNCGLGIAGKTVAECLIECHQRSVERGTPLALKTFIAGRNRLEYTSTVALAEAFKRIGTLEVVAMPQNGIRAEGVIKLAEAVRQNKGLKDLNLSDNTFGQSGSIAMAGALESLSQLELVDFGDCLCRNRGSILIARALAQSRSPLKELNLSGNEITVEAAKEIAKILAPMAGIASLKIGVNCFGSQFDDFVDFAQPYGFIDVGEESDDQGSLSDESHSDDDNSDNGDE